MTDTHQDIRRGVLKQFSEVTGLPVARITQRGRDRETAHFTLHLTGGQTIRVGTIDRLMSRTKLDQVLAVGANVTTRGVDTKTWNTLIGAVIAVAIDVDEAPDDSTLALVSDWIDQYASHAAAGDGIEEAVRAREPFADDTHLYVSPQNLAAWARREYSERINVPQLRQILAEIGFVDHRVQFNASGHGRGARRTMARYMRIEVPGIPADVESVESRLSQQNAEC